MGPHKDPPQRRARPCQAVPGHPRPCQAVPGRARPCQAVPGHPKPPQAVPEIRCGGVPFVPDMSRFARLYTYTCAT